jgi:hypothetical protein
MIIAFEPLPDLTRVHSNHRIIAGRVIGLAVKELYTDNTLFKQRLTVFQPLTYDVREELLAAGAASEGLTGENIVQFAEHCVSLI